MKNNFSKFGCLAFTALLSSCGVSDQPKPDGELQSSVLCETRPVLMRERGTYDLTWATPNQTQTTSVELNVGTTETYLDWGSLQSTGAFSATYTAPQFVPDSRTIKFDVIPEGDTKPIGSCPVYVLDSTTFGATDDGVTKGLTASVYPIPIGTPDTSFPSLSGAPGEKSVLYQFDWLNASALKGLTISNQYMAIVFTGTIMLPASTDYMFRLQANRFANFYIDDKKLVTSVNNGAAESGTLAYNYTAGKHRVKMEYHMTAPSPFSLRLEWKKRNSPTTFEAYAVVPYSAFDRD